MMLDGAYSTQLIVPFFKNFRPELVFHSLLRRPYVWPFAFLPFLTFVVLVMVGSSNAVNLTDGLDGLAIGCVVVAAGALTVLTYITSHAGFSAYLDIQHLPQVGELTIFCGALVGASLAFLWYNAHPADVFMGDVGSLAIGGSIAVIAVAIKQEILLFSVGGIFVIEALSVILQVASFRLTGKRIFRMAPLHHHFELAGWSEIENYRALLDRRAGLRAVFINNVEVEVTSLGMPRNRESNSKGKRVLVVGLARTGVATALFCAARGALRHGDRRARAEQVGDAARKLREAGMRARTRRSSPGNIPGARFDCAESWRAGDASRPRAARAPGVPIWSEIELAWRFLRGRLVAITGSNGKTTTTALRRTYFEPERECR